MFNTNRNTISDIIEITNGRRLDTMVSTADFLASKIAEAIVDKAFLASLAVAGFSAALAEQGLLQNQATQNIINNMLGLIPFLFTILMLIVVLCIDANKEYEETLVNKKQI